MARKTFGRAGQPIIIVDEPTNTVVGSVESEPGSGTDPGDNDEPASNDGETSSESGGAFEPAGETIRTIPIDATEPASGFTDPTTATGTGRKLNKDGTPRKPRGSNRPKDGTNTTQNPRIITAQLDALLFAAHTMAATMLHEPLISIDENESKILAEAIEKMANAYNLSAILSPKTQAVVDLCIAMGTVYGPKVLILRSRPRNVRNVTPINQAQTN